MADRYQLNKNKYLLDDEYNRLMHIIESFQDQDLRNCTLLLLAVNTGARASELLNLTFDDLNDSDKTIFIKGIKNSNDRELPISKLLFKNLSNIKTACVDDAKNKNLILSQKRLFPISYPRLVQIWQLYRPVHKKFHCLRHTFAIRLYKKTKDIRLLQLALGHRNIANTMIYADYIYSQQELKKLIL